MSVLKELRRAAELLQDLDAPMVFVGGSVAPLYYQNTAYLGEERPTLDVDCVIEVASRLRLAEISEHMRQLGFSEGIEPNDPICRWRGRGLVLDLVPLNETLLGFSNRWYAAGWHAVERRDLSGIEIGILSFDYYLATKIEAFSQRGQDPRMSHDLEDVFLILAARNDLNADRGSIASDVRAFLATVFDSLFRGRHADEIIGAYLPAIGDHDAEARIRRFVNRIIEG